MNCKKCAFTLVELLTVLAIIALLVALLTPAMNTVRNSAKEASQRAQLTSIEQGLLAFRNDYGDYPPSNWPDFVLPPAPPATLTDYCGAQKLAEALLGWDLMGFHPQSDFRASGVNDAGAAIYDFANALFFGQRKGRYLELTTANAFRLGVGAAGDGLFVSPAPLNADTFVICDVFAVRRMTLASGQTVRAGTPILYYKADTSNRNITDPLPNLRIYDARHNHPLVALGKLTPDGQPGAAHRLATQVGNDYPVFYDFGKNGGIRDAKVTGQPWPHRPDSFILISAGIDGEYGTPDDIRNFGN